MARWFSLGLTLTTGRFVVRAFFAGGDGGASSTLSGRRFFEVVVADFLDLDNALVAAVFLFIYRNSGVSFIMPFLRDFVEETKTYHVKHTPTYFE